MCSLSLLLYSPTAPLVSSLLLVGFLRCVSFFTFAFPSSPSSFIVTAIASTIVTLSPTLPLFSFFLFSLLPSLSSDIVVICHRMPSMSPLSQDLDLHLSPDHLFPFSRFPWFISTLLPSTPFSSSTPPFTGVATVGVPWSAPRVDHHPLVSSPSPLPSTSSTSTTAAFLSSLFCHRTSLSAWLFVAVVADCPSFTAIAVLFLSLSSIGDLPSLLVQR